MAIFSYFKDGFTGRHYTKLYCFLMHYLDYRYWRCECDYEAPYGLVVSADCKKHD